MLTVQILTLNNAKTLPRTLESIRPLNPVVIVGDMGSTDDSIEICRASGASVHRFEGMDRDEARNRLIAKSPTGTHLNIEPWEAIVQGWDAIQPMRLGEVRIMQGTTIWRENRVWDGNVKFVNPVFERLDATKPEQLVVTLASCGGLDPTYAVSLIERWKTAKPLSPTPYYYQSCLLFAQGKYDEYLKMAEHYLFVDKNDIMPITMTRYHYAMTQIIHKRAYRPALQNLNLCLCNKPLMAEFWCLTGDVYYHLLNRFDQAKEFYENALVMGSRRLQTDPWPMDFSKYGKYPKKMIESCDKIMKGYAGYAVKSMST